MPLSAYEKQRLANMEANKKQLIELGLEAAVASVRTITKTQARASVKGSAINKKAKREVVPPRSRSLRQQNKDVDGTMIPDKPVVATPEPAPRHERKPSVPLDAAKVSTGATSADEAASFLARLGDVAADATRPKTKKSKSSPAAAPQLTSSIDLTSLSVAEEDIAKLVPERIFSLAVHPSPSKLLVAAGDTWGRVGLWDVDTGDDNPVVTFEPHSRPVAGIRMLQEMPNILLSCSHDGSVRSLDLGAGGSSATFVEVYRAPEDADGDYPMLHGLSRTAGEGGVIACCRSDGAVAQLDLRVAGASASVTHLHDKKIFSVDYAPTQPYLLATASLDRTVAIWDIRAFGGAKKPKALATLDHGLSVTSARFSPSGSRLLTTCNDDLLRVFECSDGKKAGTKWDVLCAIKHNNKTGRYLTSFQAEWLRGSEETVLCGSMAQPRGIDVFAYGGAPEARLEDEHVTSVVSLLAQHPTRPVLVASNSGGKCFVWR